MKKFITLGVLFAFLVGCEPIKGTLRVFKAFTAVSEVDRPDCQGESYPPECWNPPKDRVTVEPGQYEMSFESRSSREAALSLVRGRDQLSFKIKIPEGKSLPDNGSVTLTASETGQPFDLRADMRTQIQDSERYQQFEHCTVRYEELVCRYRGRNSRRECWIEYRTRPGRMDTEFFYRSTHRDLNAEILEAEKADSRLASFSGNRTETNKIYTYRSQCW